MSNRPKVKDYRHGFEPRYGNGMVGGKWWGMKRLAHKEIDLGDIIPDNGFEDAVCAYFIEKGFGDVYAWIVVEAYFHVGSDESVGLPEICDLDESFIPDGFEDAVNKCPFLTQPEGDALKAKVQEIADDEDGYELYEIICPEKEEYYETGK